MLAQIAWAFPLSQSPVRTEAPRQNTPQSLQNKRRCVEQPCADQKKWETFLMLEDCPRTVQKKNHGERKSGHEDREETEEQAIRAAGLKKVEIVTKAKATGKAKVATKKAVVKKAAVKKGKTTKEVVQAHPRGQKTTQFYSPVYGKCKIDSVTERSYVQWQEPDTKRWLALLCSAAPNHQWQCRYLRDILIEGHSQQSITTSSGI